MTKLPIIVVAMFAAAGPARAGTRRVAIAPFTGPAVIAGEVRSAVVEVMGARHELVPAAEFEQARTVTDGDPTDAAAVLTIARLVRADAAVIGRVALNGPSYAVSLSVLRTDTGENVGAVLVPLTEAEVTPAARGRIELLLGNLLDWAEPTAPPGATAAAPAQPARVQVQVSTAPAVKKEAKPKLRFPIAFEAAVGLSATARRLSFSQEAGLADASLSANPSPGLRVEAEAATIGEPGVSLAVAIERSIGAQVGLNADGMKVPVTQMMWGFGVSGRMRYRKRWVPSVMLGYSELRYEIGQRPQSLLVPDAHYGFIDTGAAVRLEFGPAAALASARYLLPLATSGITDAGSFGAASTYGLAGEAGAEVELTDAILIRAGARYLRFSLDFEGSGDLAVALDGDVDQDVSGATDSFIGAYADAVFRF